MSSRRDTSEKLKPEEGGSRLYRRCRNESENEKPERGKEKTKLKAWEKTATPHCGNPLNSVSTEERRFTVTKQLRRRQPLRHQGFQKRTSTRKGVLGAEERRTEPSKKSFHLETSREAEGKYPGAESLETVV